MSNISYEELMSFSKEDTEKKKENTSIKLKLKDGTRVPGATTICGLLDKPFLVKWANKLGKQGIDVTEYVEKTAHLGTLIHNIIESHITGEAIELDNFSEEEIEIAENIFYNNYMSWETQHKVEPIFCEKSLVSEIYKFGGIIDFYCKLDDRYTVVDFKTSKSISEEHILQVSSYVQLLKENGYEVEQLLILDVKKDLTMKLEEKLLQITELDEYWNLFKILIDVYYSKKKLGWK